MGIEPTGTICGDTLKAIDEFGEKYTFPFKEIKCKCGICSGFGKGRNHEEKEDSKIKEMYRKYEYPGIHRSLLWGYKASLFYLQKESLLGYEAHSINSGYRCHDHDIYKEYKTTNHCGKAIDITITGNVQRKLKELQKLERKSLISI